jgi:hypothetical protein
MIIYNVAYNLKFQSEYVKQDCNNRDKNAKAFSNTIMARKYLLSGVTIVLLRNSFFKNENKCWGRNTFIQTNRPYH